MEAENSPNPLHTWLTATAQSGYTGTAYLQPSPDIDTLYQTGEITDSPKAEYPVNFTTPGTYTVWLRGSPANAAGDSVYVGLGTQVVTVTGLTPYTWTWTSEPTHLVITTTGLYTINLWMREDGLRVDRLLLTTDTTYIPTGFGPAETKQSGPGVTLPTTLLTRTIVYTYDNLYRLTNADYSTNETYAYGYDEVGNRLEQIINGSDTTTYLYDDANRLKLVTGTNYVHTYDFDNNGNLKTTGQMTNTWDAANRLIETTRDDYTLQPIYNGVNDRVGQTVGTTTTNFALDVAAGLPEVIYTSDGDVYLHLPGVIVTEKAGEVRYLLSDGLGSVRQAVDETAELVAYYEFDPYGNPVNNNGGESYGYTGEWYEGYVELLHLRARWYSGETGTFLSRDAWTGDDLQPQTFNGWGYVEGNPINNLDPSGFYGEDVHSKLTYRIVKSIFGSDPRGNSRARRIAEGNQHVDDDEAWALYPNWPQCNDCHFASYPKTMRHVNEAIYFSNNLFLFGTTLHQYQDYYSHWYEGYQEEHARHNGEKIVGLKRSQQVIDEFFTSHPKHQVLQFVVNRNPGLVTPISNDEWIDLYLRKYHIPSDSDRYDERGFYRFYTDRYIEGSARDVDMERGTRIIIGQFFRFHNDPCKLDWTRPSDVEIKTLLTS